MTTVAQSPYLRALKTALTGAGLKVGGGVAPRSSDGTIVTPSTTLYLQPSRPSGESVGCRGDDAVLSFRCISQDLTDEGAAAYDDKVKAALNGLVVTVADRESYAIRWIESSGVERDHDVTPPCFYVSSLFTLMSAYAPEVP